MTTIKSYLWIDAAGRHRRSIPLAGALAVRGVVRVVRRMTIGMSPEH
ncbi:hypothetical protein LJR034_009357 [Caballeronia sp. LjRoot34]